MVSGSNENEIVSNLQLFEKLYEVVRLIDPLAKKVLLYNKGNAKELSSNCFDLWGKNKICDNCISMRAYNENKSFVKVEYGQNKVYTVLAIPVELYDRQVVLELLKDTTDSLVIEGDSSEVSAVFQGKIDSINSLAFMDALTEVYNRRYVNEKLPVDMLNAVLLKHSLSIIMVDIDFFKKVNDTYGHLIGDNVLKSFAETISGCLKRESDWIARYGGEEFLVCLPGARIDKAVKIAEDMRIAVENQLVKCDNGNIKITASFGICANKVGESMGIDDLIDCADKKLYLAKGNGRNRVEV